MVFIPSFKKTGKIIIFDFNEKKGTQLNFN